MKIILTGIVESLSTRQDGSVSVKFSTQELPSEDGGNLFSLRNKFCKMLLTDDNISPMQEKVIVEETMQDGGKIKSKSQRLRAVLFVLFEQQGLNIEFDAFYNDYMEKFIESVKLKLE